MAFLGYPLTVVDQTDALTPSKMPHLKQLIEQPEISTLTDQQMKSLFKNAPYLMKNEISKPKFLNKMKDYVGQRASGPLRRYQAECIERFLTGENFIFVAPTGAGKTKIFVECSRSYISHSTSASHSNSVSPFQATARAKQIRHHRRYMPLCRLGHAAGMRLRRGRIPDRRLLGQYLLQ